MSSTDNSTSKWAALFISSMSAFITPFMSSSTNIALPAIAREFELDAVGLNWIPAVYILAAAIFLVPFGRIADIYGRKRIFLYGTIVYMVSSAFLGLSISGIMLISLRVIQGIGGAMIFGTGVAIVTSVFPPRERGKALGFVAASVYIGLSLGPPLGGILTHYFGWRSIFIVIVPISLVIIITVLKKLRGEWAESKGEKFDTIGSVVYGISLLIIIYGFSLLPSITGGVLIVAGIAGFVAFIKLESISKSPVLNIALFKSNPVFLFSSLAALINYCATFAIGFLISLYLQYIKGFSAEYTGLILMSQAVIQAIVSPIAGRLSDRFEPRFVASVGMTVTTIGLIMLSALGQDSGLEYIITSLVIVGLGFALFSSPNLNAAMSAIEKKYYGIASGTIGTMRLLGQSLSLAIVMLLFALFIGRVQIAPENYAAFLQSEKTAFIIFSVFCFAGIFISLARGNLRKK
jgi:EmrB/QacA subfamily drug resistance transporter